MFLWPYYNPNWRSSVDILKHDYLLRTQVRDLGSHPGTKHISWKLTDRTKLRSLAILSLHTTSRSLLLSRLKMLTSIKCYIQGATKPSSYFCCLLPLLLSPVPLFCNHMDYSPPGSSVYGISQARILEWDFWRQEFLSPGDLPDPRIEPTSPALAGGFFNP